MRKLKIGVIDRVSKGLPNTLWAKIMHASLASIVPQVAASWCKQQGHEATFICYTGLENLDKELPYDVEPCFDLFLTTAHLQMIKVPTCTKLYTSQKLK